MLTGLSPPANGNSWCDYSDICFPSVYITYLLVLIQGRAASSHSSRIPSSSLASTLFQVSSVLVPGSPSLPTLKPDVLCLILISAGLLHLVLVISLCHLAFCFRTVKCGVPIHFQLLYKNVGVCVCVILFHFLTEITRHQEDKENE